jgi:uncharacterized phage-associated protein
MKTLLEFDYKKATQAINYLAKREGGQIEKLKLIKLIYLADRYHLRRYGRPLVNDAYFAMRLGPVGSSVKDIAEFSDFLDETELSYASKYIKKGQAPHTVTSETEVDEGVFSKSEMEALTFAFDEFGAYSASSLVDITHRYPEWGRFRSALESQGSTREPMSYTDFFNDPNSGDTDKFNLSNDVLNASKELFQEDYEIAEFWK